MTFGPGSDEAGTATVRKKRRMTMITSGRHDLILPTNEEYDIVDNSLKFNSKQVIGDKVN